MLVSASAYLSDCADDDVVNHYQDRMSLPFQLPLGIQLRDDATFENFFAGARNQTVLAALTASPEHAEHFIFIYGQPGVGCSHLLQAACHQAETYNRRSVYLPMQELMGCTPDLFEGMELLDLVCIDDVEVIGGKRRWEEALFHLFNRINEAGKQLIIAGRCPPKQLPIRLQDLQSRLSWGLVMSVHALTDQEKMEALRMRAYGRGLDLSEEVGRYIIGRSQRDMNQLFSVLERLDGASLRAKRKLTVPFVKQVMSW